MCGMARTSCRSLSSIAFRYCTLASSKRSRPRMLAYELWHAVPKVGRSRRVVLSIAQLFCERDHSFINGDGFVTPSGKLQANTELHQAVDFQSKAIQLVASGFACKTAIKA